MNNISHKRMNGRKKNIKWCKGNTWKMMGIERFCQILFQHKTPMKWSYKKVS